MPSFGREEKPIDWDKVDSLLMAGCIGTEIAPFFNMHPKTFYERVQKKFGVSFTEYCYALHAKGEAHIKQKQFSKAMSGDTKMLMYLGEFRLKQRKPGNEAVADEQTTTNHDALLSAISELQEIAKSAKKKDLSNNSKE